MVMPGAKMSRFSLQQSVPAVHLCPLLHLIKGGWASFKRTVFQRSSAIPHVSRRGSCRLSPVPADLSYLKEKAAKGPLKTTQAPSTRSPGGIRIPWLRWPSRLASASSPRWCEISPSAPWIHAPSHFVNVLFFGV